MRLAVFPSFLLFFACAGPVFAQTAEFAVTGGVSRLNNKSLGVLSDAGDITRYGLTDGWRIGFRTTLNNWRFFGHEFGYAYNRTQLRNETSQEETGMAIHQGFYNLLAYGTRDGSKVRPFAAAGGHFNSYAPPGSSVTSGGAYTKFGFNYGGGVKVRVSPIFAVRFDVRQYQNAKPFDFLQNRQGLLGQLEVSVGFGLVI
ncbi:MAG TPA: outer membrane beta-barrel protein [Bryobacteraceae bacterium]|nr:outer membrane beta-barrel protein [Bryobacteraceae bacterium]